MRVTLIPARELGADLVRHWLELQQSNPDLISPYFHPEFTRNIAETREDVEVAVIEDGGRIRAFFPFQRSRNSVGIPVGGIISDYQGLICNPDFTCNPRDLVQQCRLVAWDFHHLLLSQRQFEVFHAQTNVSPRIDLSKGYDFYVRDRREAGTELLSKCRKMAKRVEREIGPLHFVAHATGIEPMRQTLKWKSRQYRATGERDLFASEWINRALERMQATECHAFKGMLSLLYAGDRLLAGHFGIRSSTAWHYWFPAYDPELAKYSPGIILLFNMVQHASALGVQTIELGAGMSFYKQRFMNASTLVASGSVELPSWRLLPRIGYKALRHLWSTLPLDAKVRRNIKSLLKVGAMSAHEK